MSVTGKFRPTITDVEDLAIDVDEDIFFTVTGESIEGVNEIADEAIRTFLASNNIEEEDKVEIEKFIE